MAEKGGTKVVIVTVCIILFSTLISFNASGWTNGDSPPSNPPDASIYANRTEGYAPLNVSFVGSGSGINSANITSYYWDFDDGQFSKQQNPFHIFNYPGNYTVRFYIMYDDGSTESAGVKIVVKKNKTTDGKNETNGETSSNEDDVKNEIENTFTVWLCVGIFMVLIILIIIIGQYWKKKMN